MLINKRNHNLKKSVAIIGSGIAGLSTAYFSQEYFDVTIFEKNDYLVGMQIQEKSKIVTEILYQ